MFDFRALTQYHSNVKIKMLVFALICVAVALSPRGVFAQTESPTATSSPTPVVSQTVDYELPYPGLLPDNPLYNLKALRDRVIEFLISTPAKKAEFYLLASDKKVNTGYYLIIKGKDDLGVLYISKSNNYMSMAIPQADAAGTTGKETLQKIKTSIKKHQEVIKLAEKDVDQKNKTKLENEIKRLSKMSTLIKK